MKKKTLIITLSFVSSLCFSASILISRKVLFGTKATDECAYHHGNHYAAKAPTASTSGYQEFWACCDCGNQYIEEPEGDWNEGNDASMMGGVAPGHIAYLGPLSKYTLSLYKDTYTLNVGDKATIDFNIPTGGMKEYGKLNFSSNNTNVSVSDNGIITANSIGSAIISISGAYVETKQVSVTVDNEARNLGFNYTTYDDFFEYDQVVHDKEELNYAMSLIATTHSNYAVLDVDLDEEIVDADFEFYFEMRDMAIGYGWFLDLESANVDSLLPGQYTIYIQFFYACDYEYNLASETTPINGHEVTELTNMMSELRHYENAHKNESLKRSDTFMDFEMYKRNNKGYMEVYNSEELWWCVSNGFIPRFPLAHSSAEEIFERCKNILRREITNDMTDAEKMLALYDYISDTYRYDYEALNCSLWEENTAWYLEGPMFQNRCVCDAFSRLYTLLCNMEGMTVDRGCGYSSTGGHAWNYAKVSDTWYLTCSTWAHSHLQTSMYGSLIPWGNEITTPYFEMTNYGTFLTDLNYMIDSAGYSCDYKDSIHNSHTESANIHFLNVYTFNNGENSLIFYDQSDVQAFAEAAYATGVTRFYVPYYDVSDAFFNNILSELYYAGYDFDDDCCQIFTIGGTNYFVFEGTI